MVVPSPVRSPEAALPCAVLIMLVALVAAEASAREVAAGGEHGLAGAPGGGIDARGGRRGISEETPQRAWSLTAGIGHPHHISYGLSRRDGPLSYGVETGRSLIEDDNVAARMTHTGLRIGLHPFRGGLYTGIAYGRQDLSVVGRQAIETFSGQGPERVTVTLDVRSTYVTPHVGYVAVFWPGLTLGTEIGYQGVLTSARRRLTGEAEHGPDAFSGATMSESYVVLERRVLDLGAELGEMGNLHITVLKLGWTL